MPNKDMKRCSTTSLSGKCKLKLQQDATATIRIDKMKNTKVKM